MVRTGARAVGTEKKDALAAYALPQAQAAAVGQAPAHPETQKQRPGMVEQGRMPRGEYGGPGGSGQGIGQKTRIAGDAGAKDARRQQQLGLDQPLYHQFWHYISNAVQGDFGLSMVSRRPVADEIASRFMPTLWLTITSMVWAVIFGMAAGSIELSPPSGVIVGRID